MTRVAWTLKYLGVPNVAILNGGQNQWVKENKPLSQDMVRAKAKSFKVSITDKLYVNKAYVMDNLGKATIIDTRAPLFSGQKKSFHSYRNWGESKGR